MYSYVNYITFDIIHKYQLYNYIIFNIKYKY